ncbi:MAG: CpsB/CapC family capsule biosynthesis tyrosine phosphatase [Actinomycetota bacterium]
MIDLHSHVLPALDDGPADDAAARAILVAARADGIEAIAATPHVRADHPTTAAQMEAGVERVRGFGVDIRVLTGGELDLEFLRSLDDATLRRFGLGGNPGLLLVETPFYGWPMSLPDDIFGLQLRGFRILLAHPERNGDVQEQPELVRRLVDAGVSVQLTAGSVDGRLGRRAAATAKQLLDLGLAHCIASDAHAPHVRAVGMRDAIAALGDAALGRWLTEDVPAALLEGHELPARPASRRRRFRKG